MEKNNTQQEKASAQGEGQENGVEQTVDNTNTTVNDTKTETIKSLSANRPRRSKFIQLLNC